MKKLLFFILMLVTVVNFNIFECRAITYVTDVENTKYENAVTYLIENNIISGYPDNTFKPNKTITRAEITTVITKHNKISLLENLTSKFNDVQDHWGKTYINTLSDLGYVSGYETGEFKPNNEVTYAEVTAMLLNSLGYKEEISKMKLNWPDNYIEKARSMELYENLDESNPNKKMTRGEVAILVYNVSGNKVTENEAVGNGAYEVINLEYDNMSFFSEGLASVKKDGKYGFVDKMGKEIVPCIYDETYYFNAGWVKVCKDGKWGIIDNTGKEIVPCMYEEVLQEEGFLYENFLVVVNDGKLGIFNKNGEQIVPCIYDSVYEFSEKLAEVEKAGEYGVINAIGEEIVPCIYDWCRIFSEDFIAVRENGRYGFVNRNGTQVINCIYEKVDNFGETTRVQKNGKYGLIDNKGKEILPCNYERIILYRKGIVLAESENEKIYADFAGNTIGNIEMMKFSTGKLEIIDESGKSLMSADEDFINISKGYELIITDEGMKIINPIGKEIIISNIENVYAVLEDFILIERDGKYVIIDETGKEKKVCDYENISEWVNGVAITEIGKGINSKYGLINEIGEEILPCIYDDINDFSGKYAVVKKDQMYGVIAENGELIIPCDYDKLYNDSGVVNALKDDQWYLIELK